MVTKDLRSLVEALVLPNKLGFEVQGANSSCDFRISVDEKSLRRTLGRRFFLRDRGLAFFNVPRGQVCFVKYVHSRFIGRKATTLSCS